MGQRGSKSYTPGEGKDAGLPTATATGNGDISVSGGANGQVELLSNKEVIDVGSPSSPLPATPSSAASPSDKKKGKKPRFVFSLRRTGSGKWSKRPRKEVNGVRPTSYPAAKATANAAQGTDGQRPQSLFLEEIAIPEDDKIETVSLSSNDESKDKDKKDSAGPSSPKGKKDKKKDSQKKKTSKKKKEKEAKAKAEKEKKEEAERKKSEEKEKEKEKEDGAEAEKNEAAEKNKEETDKEKEGDGKGVVGVAGVLTVEEPLKAELEVASEQTPSLAVLEGQQGDAKGSTQDGEVDTTEVVEEQIQAVIEQHSESAALEVKMDPIEAAVSEVTEVSPELTGDVKVELSPCESEPAVEPPSAPEISSEESAVDVTTHEESEVTSSLSESMMQSLSEMMMELPSQLKTDASEVQVETSLSAGEADDQNVLTGHEDSCLVPDDEKPDSSVTIEAKGGADIITESAQLVSFSSPTAQSAIELPDIQLSFDSTLGKEEGQESSKQSTEAVDIEAAIVDVQAAGELKNAPEPVEETIVPKIESSVESPPSVVDISAAVMAVSNEVSDATQLPPTDVKIDVTQDVTDRKIDVTQDVVPEGKIDVTQDVVLEGKIDVTQDVVSEGKIDVTQDVIPKGKIDVTQDVVPEGKIDVTQDIVPEGKIDVTQDVTLTVKTEETIVATPDVTEGKVEVLEDVKGAAAEAVSAVAEATAPSEQPAPSETVAPMAAASTPRLSPAQLKQQEKERKAAKKKEEKERARKEKEEKRRLKEQQKQEAKERKRKEKEEKERKAREAKARAKAAMNMTLEVKPPEVKVEVKPEAQVAAEPVAEEAVSASQSAVAESALSTSAALDSSTPDQGAQQAGEVAGIEPQPSTSQDNPEVGGGLLGSSVKDIISSIENNVFGSKAEAKTDDGQPPEIPSSPYPDEEPAQETMAVSVSASAVCSAPTFSSSSASSPTSPTSPTSPLSEPQSPEGDESFSGSAPASPETGENARSSVLRKIELGPRLRTAILRKSSSGAESEEKRVSLTQPRHVQASDLTPPPRKQRPRRPLEQAWSPSGSTVSSDAQVCVQETVSSSVSAVSQAAPLSLSTSQGDNSSSTVTDKPDCDSGDIVNNSSSLSQKAEDDKDFQPLVDLPSPGSRVSVHADPESPTMVSSATIVLSGQAEVVDSFPASDSPHHAPSSTSDKVKDEGQGSANPSESCLHKMATDLVVQAQRAAQEEAIALASAEKDNVMREDSDSKISSVSDSHSPADAMLVSSSKDNDAALVVSSGSGATVLKTDYVVVVDCAASKDSKLEEPHEAQPDSSASDSCQQIGSEGSPQPLVNVEGAGVTMGMATTGSCVAKEGEEESSAKEEADNLQATGESDEHGEDVTETTVDNAETDTIQLQQFNKNYYDIAVVADNDDDDDEKAEASEAKDNDAKAEESGSTSLFGGAVTLEVKVKTDDLTQNEKEADLNKHQNEADISGDSRAPACQPTQDAEKVQLVNGEKNAAADEETGMKNEEKEVENAKGENGDAAHQEQQGADKQDGDKANDEDSKVGGGRCNGSHEPRAVNADSNDTIDAYLKLQSGDGETKRMADKLETNNNISGEGEVLEQAESTASTVAAGSVD